MKSNIVTLSEIEKCGRWRVEIFFRDEGDDLSSQWPMVKLADICSEISEAQDAPRTGAFIYVGLENVEQVTGDLIGNIMKSGGEVKSRSKIFKQGDVLYGRLRPSLRKALSTTEIKGGGLCSTEFIVLRPNEKISMPVLRALLTSAWLSSQLERLQIGAALPRVSVKDLLALKVPLPDKFTQRGLEVKLEQLAKERMDAKAVLAVAASKFESAVASAIT